MTAMRRKTVSGENDLLRDDDCMTGWYKGRPMLGGAAGGKRHQGKKLSRSVTSWKSRSERGGKCQRKKKDGTGTAKKMILREKVADD